MDICVNTRRAQGPRSRNMNISVTRATGERRPVAAMISSMHPPRFHPGAGGARSHLKKVQKETCGFIEVSQMVLRDRRLFFVHFGSRSDGESTVIMLSNNFTYGLHETRTGQTPLQGKEEFGYNSARFDTASHGAQLMRMASDGGGGTKLEGLSLASHSRWTQAV
ncbi:hypothetical protein LX32DRAFT_309456 [Colletotrichum zoysiae]|uniref:Uncharacterized protein n=1 Tax=Colletotrichum zoysiae TaxID=1216348 RepID=A0AAD9HVZ5_9PEZI|nr:hypothetical protein LX32DRAFT_309456 [Colletotrichum zoysiae]